MAKEGNGHGGSRKGAGRKSKAEEANLKENMAKAYIKAMKKVRGKDFKGRTPGEQKVLETLWEISLGLHSADPNSEMGQQDLKKRFEATKEIQRLYYGPSPEGIVGSAQNKLEISDIASLVGFIKPIENEDTNEDKEEEEDE